jgi:hypothetical protein
MMLLKRLLKPKNDACESENVKNLKIHILQRRLPVTGALSISQEKKENEYNLRTKDLKEKVDVERAAVGLEPINFNYDDIKVERITPQDLERRAFARSRGCDI